MRIYYVRDGGRGHPAVLVWREGRLDELPPERHPHCPEHGHGWAEEHQGLNTAFTVLGDVLGEEHVDLALWLAFPYRAEVIGKFTGGGGQVDEEDVLRWVLGKALVYAWPLALRVAPAGKEANHVAPF
jgi:hypothetical protein